MGNDSNAPATGEVVYLLAEVPAGGEIHEIGARALVLDATDAQLWLEVRCATGTEVVTCTPTQVTRRLRRARRRPGTR